MLSLIINFGIRFFGYVKKHYLISIFLIFQLTAILLAKNLNINPFDQPAVELIKKRLKS